MQILCFEIERIRFPELELSRSLEEVRVLYAALKVERQTRWIDSRGASVKAWAEFAQRNHRDFNYPADFAEVLADTLEIKLFMAERHLRILEADRVPTASDNVQIGIEWERGRGFIIKGGFIDSLSKSISVRKAYKELRVPSDAEISVSMVRPADAAKAWKAKRPPRLKPEDGGWREPVPHGRLSPDGKADRLQQQVADELVYMERREALHMEPDPGSGTRVGELLREQFEAERYRSPDAARIKEIWDDMELFEKRQMAMKELGLVMPPEPEGLADALRGCTETLEMTREMRSHFIRLGRKDEPVPLSFHWRAPVERGAGFLFAIRFNEPDGPIGTRILRMDAFPIRAHIAPEKALAEWKALREREMY